MPAPASDSVLHAVVGVVIALGASIIGVFMWRIVDLLIELRDAVKQIGPSVSEMKPKVDRHETWLVQMRAKFGFDRNDTGDVLGSLKP